MFNYAVILIALGAAVGLDMAVQHFRGRTPPRGIVAATHGTLAVSQRTDFFAWWGSPRGRVFRRNGTPRSP